eukprot:4805355-Prymnesium_polylepis.1
MARPQKRNMAAVPFSSSAEHARRMYRTACLRVTCARAADQALHGVRAARTADGARLARLLARMARPPRPLVAARRLLRAADDDRA